jgi:hypothetical protein
MLNGITNTWDSESAEKKHASSAPYRALKADGFTSWKQVEELIKQGSLKEISREEEAQKVVLPEPPPEKRYVVVLASELNALVAEQVKLRQEVERLMARLDELEMRQASLEPVAVSLVSVPALVAEAELPKIKPRVNEAPAPVLNVERPNACDQLPTTSTYRNQTRPIRYQKAFTERLRRLDPTAAGQVLKAVKALATNQVTSGLQVKPLTPPNLAKQYSRSAVYSARASKKTRVVFEPSLDAIIFLDLLAKGAIARTREM